MHVCSARQGANSCALQLVFLNWSQKNTKAGGEVASTCHMLTNSDRLIGLNQMTFLKTTSINFRSTVFFFSSQLGSQFLLLVGGHVLHVKSGGHLRDLAAYRTSSSAESSWFSAFTFLAALHHAFIPCLEADFFTLVENPRGRITSVLPLMFVL